MGGNGSILKRGSDHGERTPLFVTATGKGAAATPLNSGLPKDGVDD